MDLAALTDRLREARRKGDHAPDWLNGTLTLERALEVQLGLLERKLAQGEALGGWKVGLTSERARSTLGVDERSLRCALRSAAAYKATGRSVISRLDGAGLLMEVV